MSSPTPGLRIVFDAMQAPSHDGAITLFLHSNLIRPSLSNPPLAGPHAHMVRILSVQNRPPFVGVPCKIIQRIAWIACFSRSEGWRRDLFNMGLVCKAWAIVLDLYFELSHNLELGSPDNDPADISCVARTISGSPERARLIKRYNSTSYKHWPGWPMPRGLDYFKAQNTILRLATALGDVTIDGTVESVLPNFVDTLSGLREVRRLTVDGNFYIPPHGARYHTLSLEDISQFIAYWPHLETWGVITGPQLLNFAGCLHQPPKLTYLRLTRLEGLCNSDLLACLTHVSPTIESLFISFCKISRCLDENYAVDATIPDMPRLAFLELSGDLSSDLTISRKVPGSTPDGGKVSELRLYHPNNSNFINLEDAINVTGWGSITITWNQLYAPDPARVQAAKEVAQRRGMSFWVFLEGSHRTITEW
ncbi:hypothetical protein H0H93_010769 [Arthromyces matolae]|nr:hypothetical protein H0H93_010769 [Arthromyces matolae]